MKKKLIFAVFLLIYPLFAAADGSLFVRDVTFWYDRSYVSANDSIYVEVIDPDLDTNGSVRETLYVQITSPTEPSGEQVQLVETWNGNGWVLRGQIFLDSSATAVPADGKIQSVVGEILTVRYNEAANLYGEPVVHERKTFFAKTVKSGGSAGNETWLASGSPYFISENYQVNVSDTVTISAGARIVFPVNNSPDPWAEGVKLTVYGHLVAVGTSADSIRFETANPAPAPRDWEGLYVLNGSVDMRYCIVRNSKYGVNWDYSYNSIPRANLVRHCSFIRHYNALRHTSYDSPYKSLIIDSNFIELFASPDSTQFTGIKSMQGYSTDDTFKVNDNKIKINHGATFSNFYGMELSDRDSASPTYYRAVIERNVISADSAYANKQTNGIYISSFKASDIRSNRINGFSKGVYFGCSSFGSRFENNILTRNHIDAYVGCDPGIPLRNNAFASSSSGGYGLYNSHFNDVDAKNVYWGESARSQMNGGGNPKNITRIYDKFDYTASGHVLYSGWLSDTNGTPNPSGMEGYIQILDVSYIQRPRVPVGQSIRVRVIDGDLNTNIGVMENVKVRFQTGVESTDTLVLQEVSMNSDTFEVVALVEELGVSTLNDGKIQVLTGQSIEFTYRDALNNYGTSVDKKYLVAVPRTIIPSGTLSSGRTVWTSANSPYWIDGSITVQYPDTLEMQAGTKVLFKANKSQEWDQFGDTLHVNGRLILNGALGDSVHIGTLNQQSQPREWYGIRVTGDGSVDVRFAKLTNAYNAIDFYYSYVGTAINNKITRTLIKGARTSVQYINNEATNTLVLLDSSKFESAPADTVSTPLVMMSWQGWSNAGDSLAIADNEFVVHSNPSNYANNTALYLYGRRILPGFKPAVITRNKIVSDSLPGNGEYSSHVGMDINQFHGSVLSNNRVNRFLTALRVADDSGTVFSGNIFNENKRHVHVSYGHAGKFNNNAFSHPLVGGYAFYNGSNMFVDAKNNYWGAPATTDMNGGGNPKNISVIYDMFDNSTKGQVQYAGWLNDTSGTPSATGVSGELRLAIADTVSRDWFLAGDTVTVLLMDSDLNTNSGAAENVKVAISSTQEPSDTITLVEQGVDTSLFSATFIVQESGSPVYGDGRLQALPGSGIMVRYQDMQNTFGQPQLVMRKALFARTYMPAGSVSMGTVLNSSGSPYVLGGNIIVGANDTLTIEQGTRIFTRKRNKDNWWDGGDTIRVFGHLQVNGAAGDSVYFDAQLQDKGPGDWSGIRIENGGTCDIRYASIWNTYCALDINTSNSDTNMVRFRLANSRIGNTRSAILFNSSTSARMAFTVDSNLFDIVLPDSFATTALNFHYNWSNGDSLLVADNKIFLHNRSFTHDGAAIEISNRSNGPDCVQARIIRNKIYADTVVGFESHFHGINIVQSKMVVIDTNEIYKFGRGIDLSDDSGIVIRANKFDGNSIHIKRGYSNGQSYAQSNDFGPFGSFAVALNSESNGNDFDARYNYWGSTVTTEMNGGGNPKNISAIYDFYDNAMCAKVLYSGWLNSPALNVPPVFTSSPAQVSIFQGRKWIYEMTATDENGDAITFELTNVPVEIERVGNTISFRPMVPGNYDFTLAASAAGQSTQQIFTLVVNPDTVKPANPLTLTATPISDSAITLSWNNSILSGTDIDSIGIWGSPTQYPDSALYMGPVVFSNKYGRNDSTGLVHSLWPKCGIYFSLFVMDSAGNWSNGASQTYASTLDLQPPEPVIGFWIEHLGFDSVRLHWGSSVSMDVESLSICMRVDTAYPVDRFDGLLGNVAGNDIAFKVSGLEQKKTARFCIYAKDSSGNWSSPAQSEIYVPNYTKPVNPLSLTYKLLAPNYVELKWDPTLLVGQGIMNVEIMWGKQKPGSRDEYNPMDTACPFLKMIMPTTEDSITWLGIDPDVDYWFALFVVDSTNLGSDTTSASMVKVNSSDFIPPPNPLVLSTEVLSENSVKLSWDPSLLNGTNISEIKLYYSLHKLTSMFDSNAVHINTFMQPFDSQYTVTWLEGKKDYWFSLFVRDSMANISDTATAAMKKVTTPDQTPPEGISALHSNYAGLGSIALDWRPSISADAEIITARYRTDGTFPVSISDGFLLGTYSPLDSIDTVTGLAEGVEHYISFFVTDSAGNISTAYPWTQTQLFVETPAKNVDMLVAAAIDTVTMKISINYAGAFADSFLVRVDTSRYVKGKNELSKAVASRYTRYSVAEDTLVTFSGLKSGELYYISIYAYNQGFISDTIADFMGDTVLMPSFAPVAPIFTTSLSDTVTIFTDEGYVVDFDAVDANGDALSYFFAKSAPSGMTIHATSGLLAWNPTSANIGIYNISVAVGDGALYDTLSYYLKIASSNRPPVFITTADSMPTWIPEKTLWTKAIRAYDPDSAKGDFVRLVLDVGPAGMKLDSTTNLLSWTPTASQISVSPTYMVYVKATDKGGLQSTLYFSIGVQNVNEKPLFVIRPMKDTAYQGLLFDRLYSAIDPDTNEVITYKLLSAPAGMVMDSSTGRITFTPVEGQVGNFTVRARVTDIGGLFDTMALNLTILNVNDPPLITTVLSMEVIPEKTLKTWTLAATDPDAGDVLRWVKLVGATAVTVDSITGRVSWTPGNSDVGLHSVSVGVKDKDGLSDTLTFSVRVTNVNDKPTVTIKEGPIVKFGAVKIRFSAGDIDRLHGIDSALSIVVSLLSSTSSVALRTKSMLLKASDSIFEFYPVADGNYTLTIAAKDDSLSETEVTRAFVAGSGSQSSAAFTFGSGSWLMASLPSDSANIPSVLADTMKRVVSWSPSKKNYIDVQEGFTKINRGMGFWIYSADSTRVAVSRPLTDTLYAGTFTIKVDTGWNIISSPYAYAVKLALSDPLRYWSAVKNDYDTTSIMEPWKGYFVHSFDAKSITLSGKPFNPDSIERLTIGKVAKLNKEAGEWLFSVRVSSGGKVDMMNSIGVFVSEDAGSGKFDMVQPPKSPDGGPLAAFVGSKAKTLLDRNVVAPFVGTREWLLYVEPAAGEKRIELSFDGVDDLPSGHSVYLDNSGECQKVSDNKPVTLELAKGRYMAVIVSDDPDYLAKRVTVFNLAQNIPNPFNPTTTINFALPRIYGSDGKPFDGEVALNLSVYDLRGRLVKRLANSMYRMGARYSIQWDGKDNDRRILSSGMYVYRLEAGTFSGVRRMIMVK